MENGIEICPLWKNENITSRESMSTTRVFSFQHYQVCPHCPSWGWFQSVARKGMRVVVGLKNGVYSFYLVLMFRPEPRSQFFDRCQRCVDALHSKFPYQRRKVLVMVSHAAGCVAMAKTLSKKNTTDITPAAPCSIFGFSRDHETDTWTIDPHDASDGLNGYTGHLSNVGSATVPWNNFGDGKVKFYTGPPTSRFAPKTT